MTIARAHLIDPAVTRWYHCITRCVRRAFLLGEGPDNRDRKLWIEKRLAELAQIFSVAVGGFSVMDNHLHVLVRLDPEVAGGWSDEEFVRCPASMPRCPWSVVTKENATPPPRLSFRYLVVRRLSFRMPFGDRRSMTHAKRTTDN
jgi:hypothetical protein